MKSILDEWSLQKEKKSVPGLPWKRTSGVKVSLKHEYFPSVLWRKRRYLEISYEKELPTKLDQSKAGISVKQDYEIPAIFWKKKLADLRKKLSKIHDNDEDFQTLGEKLQGLENSINFDI